MAFKESLKEEVRRKSDLRCVICHRPFVEIHHIKAQAEGGDDNIDNAVALCAYCHDIIGANPTKRKQLKELRDAWYEEVDNKQKTRIVERSYVFEKVKILHTAKPTDEKPVIVYHTVYENENFKDAANDIISLTRDVVKRHPNKNRALFLDIDGHRLSDGAFDADMWELQYNFILKNLIYYYSEVCLPLGHIKNTSEQLEEPIPENFVIYEEEETPEVLQQYAGTFITMNKNELDELKVDKSEDIFCNT